MEHELKILPEYFEAVLDEIKTFELRKDDRSFQVGEGIELKEFDGERYTGREVPVEIVYKLDGGKFGLEKGYCISRDKNKMGIIQIKSERRYKNETI